MCSSLSICEPHSNHKEKLYSKCTKEKWKEFEHNAKENYQNTGKGKRRQKDIQEPEKYWENKQNTF